VIANLNSVLATLIQILGCSETSSEVPYRGAVSR
jgi:hypothetical protein